MGSWVEPGGKMGQGHAIREPLAAFQLEAKARQTSKLAEIREALMEAGCDTLDKQAAALGVCRSTAWVVLNRDRRVGPSGNVIKRILSSPKLPPAARRKVEEYVEERISGLYGHTEFSTRLFRKQFRRLFRDQFRMPTEPTTKREQGSLGLLGRRRKRKAAVGATPQ